MRVDRPHNIFKLRTHLNREPKFSDQLRGVRSNDFTTEDKVGLRVGNDANESVSGIKSENAARSLERHFADDWVKPLFLCCRFV